MFEISKNMFFENNNCNYIDEYQNKVFIRRTEDGFVAKLRFADENIKAAPLNVSLFSGEMKEGDNLHLEFKEHGILEKEDVKKGIGNFTELINYWIKMLYDIKFLDMKDSYFMNANPGITREEIAEHKYSLLLQYKELEVLLKTIGL